MLSGDQAQLTGIYRIAGCKNVHISQCKLSLLTNFRVENTGFVSIFAIALDLS